jgi:hypothetical protein
MRRPDGTIAAPYALMGSTRASGVNAVVSLLISGCIAAPGIPGGPMQGPSVALTGTYGYALAPAEVQLHRSTDDRRLRQWDETTEAVNLPVAPARGGARVGLSDWLDVAADVGFLESGAEVRVGVPEGSRPLPFAISVGSRWGALGLLDRHQGEHREGRVRFEIYPRLHGLDRGVRMNLIGTLGASFGRRYRALPAHGLPPALVPDPDEDHEGWPTVGTWNDPTSYVLRDETRLEATLGIEKRKDRTVVSFFLMPYWTVAHGRALDAGCSGCQEWRVERLAARFGLALFATATFTWKPIEGTLPSDAVSPR